MRNWINRAACAALALLAFACTPEAITTDGVETNSARFTVLDEMFTDYEVVTIDHARLHDEASLAGEGEFRLDPAIPTRPDWVFDVMFEDFYGDDYKAYTSNAAGENVEDFTYVRDLDFHGSNDAGTAHALWVMNENHLTAEIYEGDVQYGLDPVREYDASAPANQYVIYRLDADKLGNQWVCDTKAGGFDVQPEGGEDFQKATCRELGIGYVADNELYRNRGRSSSNTRSWCEARLKFGSYRYWRYNDYPLFMRVYTSYVRTGTSNPPSTSSNSSTSLSQFRSWSENNMAYSDDRMLFTGRQYGGGLGIAYVGVVCSNSVYSKGIVIKQTGISNATLSKSTGHEVGHTLGAGHQNTGFMKQGNHSNTGMPSATRNQLNNHINSNNGCMSNRTCRDFQN